jgi:acyl-CoA synthetase (AMP-forming)/AMP-acid ligase II/NAD(P)-dependent dehydrogenase (short-subunit alcohol dehydrogenase family)
MNPTVNQSQRLVSQTLGWAINPPGGVGDDELARAVAGKVILVTGASFGLGEATARRLARAGATVLMAARTAERLEEVAAEIARHRGTAVAYPADLTDPDDVDALVARVLAEHGHVDVLVSNAGKSIRRSLELSLDRPQDFQRTIDINYMGPVRLMLALLPSMIKRGEGHIVNVSTIGTRIQPGPRWAAYQASKGAFDVFFRSAAIELRPKGITATSVYMALIFSRMSSPTPIMRQLPGQTPEQAADVICRAIVKRPREIAPWWAPVADISTTAGRRPWELATGLMQRFSRDTSAARARSTSMRACDAAVYVRGLRALTGAGVIALTRPDRALRGLLDAAQVGPGPAAIVSLSAAHWPHATALVDERGSITYAQLARRCGAIAAGLATNYDVGPTRSLAIMCRNHTGFAEALIAGSRVGADILLLNTDFPGPQLAQALQREAPGAIVHDEEFSPVIDAAGFAGPRVLAWNDGAPHHPTLDTLAAAHDGEAPASRRVGRLTILTSGTTGVPKGAPRSPSPAAVLGPAIAMLEGTGARTRETHVVGPPFFHGFGLGGLLFGLALGATVVTQRRFDAEATLEAIAHHRATTLTAVPVMLQRMLDASRNDLDTSSLRAVVSGAAPLSPVLATAFMDRFGDILSNGYGSSEAGIATLATPADLRADPGTVGKPVPGIPVKILDADRRALPGGQIGRIFVGGPGHADGYTGGGSKEIVAGMVNTGDLGHYDAAGRLHIDGREDDMIVSGGENVFPGEVEDTLAAHPAVADVAVIAVPDEEFGQRLAAYVVPSAGAAASADELKAHVKGRLARYKVPRDIHFLRELPRNPTGKLLRRELPAQETR